MSNISDEKWNAILNRMLKPELVDLANKYNRTFNKISNVSKLKKSELKVELLFRKKKIVPIWSGEKKVKEVKTRKGYTKKKVLTKDEEDGLIKQSIELSEKAMNTKDQAEKSTLLKEVQKINTRLKRFMA